MAKKTKKLRATRRRRPKYQPFPDLPPEEFESLKADIGANGLHYPLIKDEHGDTLDGHQRERALRELGIKNYPVKVVAGLTDEEKWQYALAVNVKRRHLTTAEKRALIEQELRAIPDLANNWLAEIVAVDVKTVLAARKRLEAALEIPKLKKLRGKDGRQRRATYRHVLANSPAELAVAQKIVARLPPSCNGKLFDTTTASRRLRRTVRVRECAGKLAKAQASDSIRLYSCPFQRLRKVAGLRANSANLILTDIPYGKEFLPQLDDLGRFAKEILVEGGMFVTFCGQYYFDQYIRVLGHHLTYRWTMASIWEKDGNVIHPLGMMNVWKPVLLFSKGPYQRTTGRHYDVLPISKEKSLHLWQQPLGAIVRLVQHFSDPGDLVVDPCAGTFTTALACRNLSRRFLGCDIDEECVIMGQERLASSST